jgi:hypothetical protein
MSLAKEHWKFLNIINGNVSFGGLILVTIFCPIHFDKVSSSFYGHPFAPIWFGLLKKKTELEEWAKGFCSKFMCTRKV